MNKRNRAVGFLFTFLYLYYGVRLRKSENIPVEKEEICNIQHSLQDDVRMLIMLGLHHTV